MRSDFTRKLMRWHHTANRRQMPWKGESDPYRIWLSEVMLQQTTVGQGLAYYNKFITRFSNISELAAASDQEVYKMWEGLGYYSRCRNLLAAARAVVRDFGGVFPANYKEILALPGVGPYTAAAIASFAFGQPLAVVDGNVQRVVSRYFGISTPIDTTDGKRLYRELAQSLLDHRSPGVYNQAIMDFGATICKPRNPLCNECVQAADCEAFNGGFVQQLPVKQKSIVRKKRWFYYFVLLEKENIYVRKREQRDIWQNLYEFVLLERDEPDEDPAPAFLSSFLGHRHYSIAYSSGPYTQQLTHQQISGRFFVVRLKKHSPRLNNYASVERSAIGAYAFPGFINSFLKDTSHNW